MKRQNLAWMLLAPAVGAFALFMSVPLRAEVLEQTKNVAGTTVHYKIVLPVGYDPAKAYPAILAFGGGPQDMFTVDNILNRNFRVEAEKRGYIVVAPAAPDGDLFYEEGSRVFPEFLKMVMADHKIQDDKFHVAGPSNGGIAALHVAASNPQYFLSVTSFPGFMWQPRAEKLRAISKMCVSCMSASTTPIGGTPKCSLRPNIFVPRGRSRAIRSRRISRTDRLPTRRKSRWSSMFRPRRWPAPARSIRSPAASI
jgi:poly(3-hydroxybutyrate) depolymerase